MQKDGVIFKIWMGASSMLADQQILTIFPSLTGISGLRLPKILKVWLDPLEHFSNVTQLKQT